MKNSLSAHNERVYSYIPDAKDMKIIKCLCDNARLPYSKIGSQTRISKDRVRERLKNLEKELFILSYTPLINYRALGYRLYHVYLRLNKSLSSKDRFIVRLKNHEKVVALTRIAGKWDLEIQVLGKNKSELSGLLAQLGIKPRIE